jgi:hypothetical protein
MMMKINENLSEIIIPRFNGHSHFMPLWNTVNLTMAALSLKQYECSFIWDVPKKRNIQLHLKFSQWCIIHGGDYEEFSKL